MLGSNLTDITEALKRGEIDPDTALERFECPAKPLADIDVDLDVSPLTCGFPSFEKYFYLRKGQPDLVTVAARPGVGKTSLAMQLSLNVAQHTPVMVFSIEMTAAQLKSRILSVETGRSSQQLKHPDNRPLIEKANARFRRLKLVIDDQNSIDLSTLTARSLDYKRRFGLGLIVVDYLQIVSGTPGRSKAEEIADVAEGLKTLAKEAKCPVLALAQMNRMFDGRVGDDPEARPVMSDLADSAGIEKWSDVVLCMHKPFPHSVKVFALKNRNYEMKDFNMQFSGELTKFIDNSHESL